MLIASRLASILSARSKNLFRAYGCRINLRTKMHRNRPKAILEQVSNYNDVADKLNAIFEQDFQPTTNPLPPYLKSWGRAGYGA